MLSSESVAAGPSGPLPSIGATLEQVRLNHRIARLTRALDRLDRIAAEATAAGQPIPAPLIAAQRAFRDELTTSQHTLGRLPGAASA